MNGFEKRMSKNYNYIALALLTTFVLLVFVASASAQAKTFPGNFANLAEKLLPSVVNISTTQLIKGRSGPAMPQLPPGSPFEEFFKWINREFNRVSI